jgi:hypothetical protein
MDRCKDHLNIIQVNEIMTEELANLIAPGCSGALKRALFALDNPFQTLNTIHSLIQSICSQLENIIRSIEDENNEKIDISNPTLYLSETFGLMLERWSKINKEFFSKKTEKFDLTKVLKLSNLNFLSHINYRLGSRCL